MAFKKKFPASVLLALVITAICRLPAVEINRPLMRDFIGINGHTIQFKPRSISRFAAWCAIIIRAMGFG